MSSGRLPFSVDRKRIAQGLFTGHGGLPLLVELLRVSGTAEVIDRTGLQKKRDRGLAASQFVETLLMLWASGGERCEDLEHFRADLGLQELVGFDFPAVQTMRDFLSSYHDDGLGTLWEGAKSSVPQENSYLQGLLSANKHFLRYVQKRKPTKCATLDIDATILECTKQSAKPTYDGRRGYQPVVVLWAEQDLIIADEFRDGNVPAGSGNLRVVKKALDALPPGITQRKLRADSALYEYELLRYLDEQRVTFAISADMSTSLRATITAVAESEWEHLDATDTETRACADVVFVPENKDHSKDTPTFRYIAVRIRKRQGALFTDGSDTKYFCIVTNHDAKASEVLAWHRAKAGTIEHVHHVMANELAAEGLPANKFGINAAWFRLNALCYNLLSAFKRITLDKELHNARPKRLRFLIFNTFGQIIKHARETLLTCAAKLSAKMIDHARLKIRPAPA